MTDGANGEIRVAVIGAGIAGVACAYRLLARAGIATQVFEQRDAPGGVWLANAYPGTALDNEAHSYTFMWAPNPDWSSTFAPGAEVRPYIESSIDKAGIGHLINYNRKLVDAEWDEARCLWKLNFQVVETEFRDARGNKIESSSNAQQPPLGIRTVVPTAKTEQKEFEWLVSCIGMTCLPVMPEIEGAEKFQGVAMHTAEWDTSFNPAKPVDAAKGETNIVIVGVGASSAQLLPELAKYPHNKITVVARSGVQAAPKPANKPYSDEQRQVWRKDAAALEKFRQSFFAQYDILENAVQYPNGWIQWIARTGADWYTWFKLKKPEHYELLRNRFPFACNRPIFDDGFLASFNLPNVSLARGTPAKLDSHAVILDSGVSVPCDILVWATGFDGTFIAPWRTRAFGKTHAELWANGRKVEHLHYITTRGLPNHAIIGPPHLVVCPYAYLVDVYAEYLTRLVLRTRELKKNGAPAAIMPRKESQDEFMAQLWKKSGAASLWPAAARGSTNMIRSDCLLRWVFGERLRLEIRSGRLIRLASLLAESDGLDQSAQRTSGSD